MTVSQKSEVADSHETLGQYVLEESPQELGRRDSHLLLLVSMRVILPQEGHLPIRDGDDAVIGDGHTVGVAGQVTEDMLRAAERRFRIDHPFAAVSLLEQTAETATCSEVGESAVELELALSNRFAQEGQKLSAKDPAQHSKREQEAIARTDPS